MDKIKKIQIFFVFSTYSENYRKRVCKSTNNKNSGLKSQTAASATVCVCGGGGGGGGLNLIYWPNIRHRFCFRLHSTSTIRVCMNYNVNILSPSYKIYQTCLILKYHPSRIVSMNENYIINMFTKSIPHLIYPFKLTYYEMPCFIM